MSSKYAKTGWKKYEFPPDMITQEQKDKTMKLNKYQMMQMIKDRINGRILISGQKGDRTTEDEWKRWLVRMENRSIAERVNEEFIQDFIQWLQGRSTWNSKEFDKVVYDENGRPKDRKLVPGTPWGNKPLTYVPGVCEFLDQGVDRRDTVIKYLTKLKMRTPRNLDECWMYFKYIIRGVGLDENGINEVSFYSKFDYPEDPGPSGGQTGPGHPSPPLHNAAAYSANFRAQFDFAKNDPAAFVGWLLSGAPPKLVLPKGFQDFVRDLYKQGGFTDAEALQHVYDYMNAAGYTPHNLQLYGPSDDYMSDYIKETIMTQGLDKFPIDYRELSPADQDLMVAVAYANYVGQLLPGDSGTAPGGVPIVTKQNLPKKMTAFGGKKTADQQKEEEKKAKKLVEEGVKVKKEPGYETSSWNPFTYMRKAVDGLRGRKNVPAKERAQVEKVADQLDRAQQPPEKRANYQRVPPPPNINEGIKPVEAAKDAQEIHNMLNRGQVKPMPIPGLDAERPRYTVRQGDLEDEADIGFGVFDEEAAESEDSDYVPPSEESSSDKTLWDVGSSFGDSDFKSFEESEEERKNEPPVEYLPDDQPLDDVPQYVVASPPEAPAVFTFAAYGAGPGAGRAKKEPDNMASSADDNEEVQQVLQQADEKFGALAANPAVQELKEAIKGVSPGVAKAILTAPQEEVQAFVAATEMNVVRNNILDFAKDLPGTGDPLGFMDGLIRESVQLSEHGEWISLLSDPRHPFTILARKAVYDTGDLEPLRKGILADLLVPRDVKAIKELADQDKQQGTNITRRKLLAQMQIAERTSHTIATALQSIESMYDKGLGQQTRNTLAHYLQLDQFVPEGVHNSVKYPNRLGFGASLVHLMAQQDYDMGLGRMMNMENTDMENRLQLGDELTQQIQQDLLKATNNDEESPVYAFHALRKGMELVTAAAGMEAESYIGGAKKFTDRISKQVPDDIFAFFARAMDPLAVDKKEELTAHRNARFDPRPHVLRFLQYEASEEPEAAPPPEEEQAPPPVPQEEESESTSEPVVIRPQDEPSEDSGGDKSFGTADDDSYDPPPESESSDETSTTEKYYDFEELEVQQQMALEAEVAKQQEAKAEAILAGFKELKDLGKDDVRKRTELAKKVAEYLQEPRDKSNVFDYAAALDWFKRENVEFNAPEHLELLRSENRVPLLAELTRRSMARQAEEQRQLEVARREAEARQRDEERRQREAELERARRAQEAMEQALRRNPPRRAAVEAGERVAQQMREEESSSTTTSEESEEGESTVDDSSSSSEERTHSSEGDGDGGGQPPPQPPPPAPAAPAPQPPPPPPPEEQPPPEDPRLTELKKQVAELKKVDRKETLEFREFASEYVKQAQRHIHASADAKKLQAEIIGQNPELGVPGVRTPVSALIAQEKDEGKREALDALEKLEEDEGYYSEQGVARNRVYYEKLEKQYSMLLKAIAENDTVALRALSELRDKSVREAEESNRTVQELINHRLAKSRFSKRAWAHTQQIMQNFMTDPLKHPLPNKAAIMHDLADMAQKSGLQSGVKENIEAAIETVEKRLTPLRVFASKKNVAKNVTEKIAPQAKRLVEAKQREYEETRKKDLEYNRRIQEEKAEQERLARLAELQRNLAMHKNPQVKEIYQNLIDAEKIRGGQPVKPRAPAPAPAVQQAPRPAAVAAPPAPRPVAAAPPAAVAPPPVAAIPAPAPVPAQPQGRKLTLEQYAREVNKNTGREETDEEVSRKHMLVQEAYRHYEPQMIENEMKHLGLPLNDAGRKYYQELRLRALAIATTEMKKKLGNMERRRVMPDVKSGFVKQALENIKTSVYIRHYGATPATDKKYWQYFAAVAKQKAKESLIEQRAMFNKKADDIDERERTAPWKKAHTFYDPLTPDEIRKMKVAREESDKAIYGEVRPEPSFFQVQRNIPPKATAERQKDAADAYQKREYRSANPKFTVFDSAEDHIKPDGTLDADTDWLVKIALTPSEKGVYFRNKFLALPSDQDVKGLYLGNSQKGNRITVNIPKRYVKETKEILRSNLSEHDKQRLIRNSPSPKTIRVIMESDLSEQTKMGILGKPRYDAARIRMPQDEDEAHLFNPREAPIDPGEASRPPQKKYQAPAPPPDVEAPRIKEVQVPRITAFAAKVAALTSSATHRLRRLGNRMDAPQEQTRAKPTVIPSYMYEQFHEDYPGKYIRSIRGYPMGVTDSSSFVSNIERAPNKNYQAAALQFPEKLAVYDFIDRSLDHGGLSAKELEAFFQPITAARGLRPDEYKQLKLSDLHRESELPFMFMRHVLDPVDPGVSKAAGPWNKKFNKLFLGMTAMGGAWNYFKEDAPYVTQDKRLRTMIEDDDTVEGLFKMRDYSKEVLQRQRYEARTPLQEAASRFVNAKREGSGFLAVANKVREDPRIIQAFGQDKAKEMASNLLALPANFRKSSALHPGYMFAKDLDPEGELFKGRHDIPQRPSVKQMQDYNKYYDNYAALLMLQGFAAAAAAKTKADFYLRCGKKSQTPRDATLIDDALQHCYDAYTNAEAARKQYSEKVFADVPDPLMDQLGEESNIKVNDIAQMLFTIMSEDDRIEWKNLDAYLSSDTPSKARWFATNVTELAGIGRMLKGRSWDIIQDINIALGNMMADDHALYPRPVTGPMNTSIQDPSNHSSYFPEFMMLLETAIRTQEKALEHRQSSQYQNKPMFNKRYGPSKTASAILEGPTISEAENPIATRFALHRLMVTTPKKDEPPFRFTTKRKARGLK